MLDDGERLVPGFRHARALRVWAGVRPLFQDAKASGSSRDVTRAHAMLDHRERDGVDGFLTITGGKLTTMRLMARDIVDAMCAQLGDDRPCTTDQVVLPGSEDLETYHIGARLKTKEDHLLDDQLVCECELIPRAPPRGDDARARHDEPRRHPPQPAPRHGPVPGRLLHLPRDRDPARRRAARRGRRPTTRCATSSQERWKGVWPILYGDQLRQARLDDWIFQGLLDVEHLPAMTSPGWAAPSYDVLVIGAGLAGLTAAARLAEDGAKVMLIAKGVGATHLGPGTIDVLGYAGAEDRVERPGEALARPRRRPPVRAARRRRRRRAERRLVQAPVRRRPARARTATAATLEENVVLPTTVGAPKPSRGRPRDDGRGRPARRRGRCSSSASTRCATSTPPTSPTTSPRGGVAGAVDGDRPARRRPSRRPTASGSRGRSTNPDSRADDRPSRSQRGLDGAERVGFPAGARRRGPARRLAATCRSSSGGRSSRSRRCRRPCPGCASSRRCATGCARAAGGSS